MTTPPPTTVPDRPDLTGRAFAQFRRADGPPTELILLRHGQTAANIAGLLVGRQDVLLTDLGHQQAMAAGAAIAALEPDVLITSPLQRARQTCLPIAAATGLYPVVVEEIAEFGFGELEGWTHGDVLTSHPHLGPLLDGSAHPDDAWPGGDSSTTFAARVMHGFAAILDAHPGRRVVVVTHGGVIGQFASILADDPAQWFFTYLVRNCSISRFTVDRYGSQCMAWNVEEHLADLASPVPGGQR